MKYLILFSIALVAACGSARQTFRAPDQCNRQTFRDAAIYDSSQWRALEGRFRIFEVDTVNGRVSEVESVQLAAPDSTARAPFVGPRQQIRRGVLVSDSTPLPIPQLVGVERTALPVQFDLSWRLYADRTLVHGCPSIYMCVDDSPTQYAITHVSDAGFFGVWDNPMSGNYRLYDPRTKRLLPAPSGYFCALRRRDA
jgi:hypothetical protein